MTLAAKLEPSPVKRLLALDGGGIRGTLTIEILAVIEDLLRRELHRDQSFVLADYFDYIAGTSTGAIIAACLSLGMPISQVRAFYEANGAAMFDKASLLRRFRYKFEDDKLAAKLRDVFDGFLPQRERERGQQHVTLGSEALRTLLLVVMRNATTDSPWPLSNNPRARYNAPDRPYSNLQIPLWQLVRASTAAPTYFPPEEVVVGKGQSFLFVDGGVTTYNNPAFLLFLMATVEAYQLGWPVGVDKMLLISVGTGTSAGANQNLDPSEMNLLYNAASIPSALMYAALNEQDLLCRVFGRCRIGSALDREVGNLILTDEEAKRSVLPKHFTYARYNAELTRPGLDALGLRDIEPEHVQQLDSVDHIGELQRVGREIGKTVDASHFAGFLK